MVAVVVEKRRSELKIGTPLLYRGRLSGNSLPENRFPVLDRFSSAEGVDVGTSTTEDGKNLAKVGSDNPVSRVFGRSGTMAILNAWIEELLYHC